MLGFGRRRQRELIERLECSDPQSFGRAWARRIVVEGDTAQLAESWPLVQRDAGSSDAPWERAVAFSGPVKSAAGYAGCPHCGGRYWIVCDCGTAICTGGGISPDRCVCPHCRQGWSLGPVEHRLTVFELRSTQARLPGPALKRLPAPLPALPHIRRK